MTERQRERETVLLGKCELDLEKNRKRERQTDRYTDRWTERQEE